MYRFLCDDFGRLDIGCNHRVHSGGIDPNYEVWRIRVPSEDHADEITGSVEFILGFVEEGVVLMIEYTSVTFFFRY
jgi:hypothetical protein